MEIKVIYRDSNGNVIDKKEVSKKVRVSSPRIRTLVKDQYGFEYKSTRSKNSEVKVSYREPQKNDSFKYNENDLFIRASNDKYSLSFNKKTGKADFSKIISPSLVRGYEEGKETFLRSVFLAIEDVQSIKNDKEMLNLLVEV